MLDERLGRHSVTIVSLALIPALIVITMLALGIAHPGESHSRGVVGAVLSAPPLIAFALGVLNGQRLVRSLLPAVGAFVMIGVWYAVLFLPAAAICTVTRGGSCM